MPRRKLPSPEEYGRRLADAKRRAEKQKHEVVRRSENSFDRMLMVLEEQKRALASVGAELERLPREVLTPGDMHQALTELSEQLRIIQSTVENIDLDIPAPVLPESLEQTLNDLLQLARQPVVASAPPSIDPQMPLDPPHTIFSGPITLKVIERDSNGDIDTVHVEPTRH